MISLYFVLLFWGHMTVTVDFRNPEDCSRLLKIMDKMTVRYELRSPSTKEHPCLVH